MNITDYVTFTYICQYNIIKNKNNKNTNVTLKTQHNNKNNDKKERFIKGKSRPT